MKAGRIMAGTVVMVGLLAAGGFGGGQGGHKGMGGGGMEMGIFHCHGSELNLTSSQQSELQQLASEMRTNMQALHEDNAANAPMKQAFASGSFNQETFLEASSALHTQVTKLRANYFGLMIDVLDDTQKAALSSAIKNGDSSGCKGRGRRGF